MAISMSQPVAIPSLISGIYRPHEERTRQQEKFLAPPQRRSSTSSPPNTASYAPQVPSPLNPKPIPTRSSSLPFSAHATECASPKPKAQRRKKARHVSPTQRLLRQKAEYAWRSQTRLNSLMTSPAEFKHPSHGSRGRHHDSAVGSQWGRENWSVSGGLGAEYLDVMLHPNMVSLMEDLARDNPVVVSVSDEDVFSLDSPPLATTHSYGAPTDVEAGLDTVASATSSSPQSSPLSRDSDVGLGIRIGLGLGIRIIMSSLPHAFSQPQSSQRSSNNRQATEDNNDDQAFSEKDALLSPTSFASSHGCTHSSTPPLLPLHHRHRASRSLSSIDSWDGEDNESFQPPSLCKVFFVVLAVVLMLLCVYLTLGLVCYPKIQAGFEFV